MGGAGGEHITLDTFQNLYLIKICYMQNVISALDVYL